jgi:2-keto-4-pentenoate hydratase
MSVDAIAGELLDAYRTRVPVEQLTARYPELTLEDAYAIQLAQVAYWTAEGAEIKGHKVGLTSAPMQEMLGIDQPDYGHLRDDMLHRDGDAIPAEQFIAPRAEPELGFVLKERLAGPGVTLQDAMQAVGSVAPALELIDSRIRDWKIGLLDTIADNASSGAVVLGAVAAADDLDLPGIRCSLSLNGEVVETGDGAAVLGNPLAAVAWLANTLAERGIALEAGHVVLPGACTRAVPFAAGDTVAASFDGLGTVTARFV